MNSFCLYSGIDNIRHLILQDLRSKIWFNETRYILFTGRIYRNEGKKRFPL